jgi:hypothetical protein
MANAWNAAHTLPKPACTQRPKPRAAFTAKKSSKKPHALERDHQALMKT